MPEHITLPQLLVGYTQVPADALEPQYPAQVPDPMQGEWPLCGPAMAGRFWHIPWRPAKSQATHGPEQAVLQQYPSGEQGAVEMQPAATVLQVCPSLLLQAPVESQVPAQRAFGSSMLLAATQLWLVELHIMQVPVQSLLMQQLPVPVGMQVVVPFTVHGLVVLDGQV
jgi:hypothetical protein